jgi:hypothetical protein
MSAHRFDLDLTQPSQSGVYFVGADDLDRLAKAARRDALQVCRTDLGGCTGKQQLLQRLAVSLTLPADFGYNWDALADCLRDMGWLPAWGYVLLFERGDDLRRAVPADFTTLLGVLDDAATFGADRDMPWFAFLALPDEAFDGG